MGQYVEAECIVVLQHLIASCTSNSEGNVSENCVVCRRTMSTVMAIYYHRLTSMYEMLLAQTEVNTYGVHCWENATN